MENSSSETISFKIMQTFVDFITYTQKPFQKES